MQVTKVQAAAGKVTITGRVLGPQATRAADRAIEVQRRRSCSSNEVVARVKPGKDGRFRVTLDLRWEGQHLPVKDARDGYAESSPTLHAEPHHPPWNASTILTLIMLG